MSVLTSIRSQFVPIHREGYPFIAAFAVLALVLFWLWQPLGWLGAIMTAWCAYFFRDPVRVTPVREGLIVSPADGTVSRVAETLPPPQLGLGTRPLPCISIFMSVFNCHVNRSPMSGTVTLVDYRSGKFLNADLDKASEDNERNALVIEGAATRIGVVQIAGLIARRIKCYKKAGDAVTAGERFGLIRFGSRLDVYLPEGARPLVGVGQTAVAGETVLADLQPGAGPIIFRHG